VNNKKFLMAFINDVQRVFNICGKVNAETEKGVIEYPMWRTYEQRESVF